jgi:type II secretory pathway pseudopilin PulG
MRGLSHLYEDDAGVSVMIEYIFAIVIMSVLFTMVVLLMNSMINNSDNIVTEQELGIVAHDISNRMSSFSQKISADQYVSDYQTNTVSENSKTIDLPDLVGGKPYTIDISCDSVTYPGTYTGTVKVSYSQNPNINRSVSFASAYEVEATTFSSNSADLKIYYDDSGVGKIKVGY